MDSKRDGGLRFLFLRGELTVYEAAQVVEGQVGHHPDCIKLLVEAVRRGELAACIAPWHVTDYENGDYLAGVNEMETTVRRSDLNDWCSRAGIRINDDPQAAATATTDPALPSPHAADATRENTPPGRLQLVTQQQEDRILQELRKLKYTPDKLPPLKNGRPTPKAAVRAVLETEGAWTKSKFNKAWERLRSDGRIAEDNNRTTGVPE